MNDKKVKLCKFLDNMFFENNMKIKECEENELDNWEKCILIEEGYTLDYDLIYCYNILKSNAEGVKKNGVLFFGKWNDGVK